MRNRLETVDLEELDANGDHLYWAEGRLAGVKASVYSCDPKWVSLNIGPVSIELSPDAASEVAKHLLLAVKALAEEVSHD